MTIIDSQVHAYEANTLKRSSARMKTMFGSRTIIGARNWVTQVVWWLRVSTRSLYRGVVRACFQ
jgi:hypothetical protein